MLSTMISGELVLATILYARAIKLWKAKSMNPSKYSYWGSLSGVPIIVYVSADYFAPNGSNTSFIFVDLSTSWKYRRISPHFKIYRHIKPRGIHTFNGVMCRWKRQLTANGEWVEAVIAVDIIATSAELTPTCPALCNPNLRKPPWPRNVNYFLIKKSYRQENNITTLS